VNNPANPNFLKVFGTWMNTNQFVVVVSAAAIALGTTLVLRLTPLGLATRASVDHPRNASIAGINTEGVTAASWMTGTMLAGFAGVLLGPVVGLAEFQFTLLLVGSFAAVVIGRMTSLPFTFVGAIGIGLAQQIWVKYQPVENEKWLGINVDFLSKGVSASIPFVVMLGFLVAYSFSKRGLRREAFELDLRSGRGVHGDLPPLPPAHGWRRAAGPLVCAVILAALPFLFDDTNVFGATFDSFWIAILTQGLALSIIFLSYTMVTGEGGMIALSQITFAGIGAFSAARFAEEAGFPVWAAILVGACVAIPFGLLVALPSLRIGDLYLALLTIGFALLIEQLVWTRAEYDNFGAGRTLDKPFGLTISGESRFLISLDDRIWLYLIVAVVFGALALLIVNMKRSTAGLVFASIRSSEPASSTTGISIIQAKLIIFAVSSFVAGLGGALYASSVGRATPRSFAVIIGIVWLAIVVTWGVRSVIGAILAGMIFAIAPNKLGVILILIFVFVVGGFITQLVLSKTYRTPLGFAAIAALAAFAVVGVVWLWDNVTNTDAVNTILVLISLAISVLIALRIVRTPTGKKWLKLGIAAVFVIAGLLLALQFVTGGISINPETAQEVPVLLFGLGAIALAREPRGVIYDMVNRQRLRQFQDAERRDEQARLEADDATTRALV
jgi:branched-chain amino acid transport system permease protein